LQGTTPFEPTCGRSSAEEEYHLEKIDDLEEVLILVLKTRKVAALGTKKKKKKTPTFAKIQQTRKPTKNLGIDDARDEHTGNVDPSTKSKTEGRRERPR